MSRATKNPLNKYQPLGENSSNVSIDDDEEDDSVEISLQPTNDGNGNSSSGDRESVKSESFLLSMWNLLTFSFVKPLLELGNQRALEQSDLYPLSSENSAVGVNALFNQKWAAELKTGKPSVGMAFMLAFGTPFAGAGVLKLIHDSCLFISPMMLNHLINFLGDPSIPVGVGLGYVAVIFAANVVMSLSLRQYFYWCYVTGMRLRSATITAVYSKSLVLSAGSLNSRTSGEIMNLMAVDASRMQDLTPYLHAIWYSFFQIAMAIYFLWGQVSYAALAGVACIILLIPMTSYVSSFLKNIQKDISRVRDERVKITNEVLAGMKVIKFQAWEQEFQQRVLTIRANELALFRKYIIMQSLSSALYSSVPLLVSITTFTTYVIIMGETLTISKALTALALFDILRFPLFVLPNVLNNVIEAKVSLDRIQSFLLEPDSIKISTTLPGTKNSGYANSYVNTDHTMFGVYMHKASLVCEKVYNADEKRKGRKGAPAAGGFAAYWVDSSNGADLSNSWALRVYHLLWSALLTTYHITKRKLIRMFRNAYGSPRSRSTIIGPEYDSFIAGGASGGSGGVEQEEEEEEEEDVYAGREFSYRSQLYTQMMLLNEAEAHILRLECQLEQCQLQRRGGVGSGSGSSSSSSNNNGGGSSVSAAAGRSEPSNFWVAGAGPISTRTGSGGGGGDASGSPQFKQQSSSLIAEGEEEEDDEEEEEVEFVVTPGVGAVAGAVSTSSASSSQSRSPAGATEDAAATPAFRRPEALTLSRVTLSAGPGEVVAIVGPVGCGKSSVLRALLGDLRLCYGDVAMRGSCSYVGQKPFIQNATLKDNILFGSPMDEERYQQTLSMCALLPDLDVLPAGDATEIGERGINLSGGQKTRVALARAVYADSDVYLFDDPLAAVDAHVGQHLFSKCILALKRQNKCVVFVTNALQFTKLCTKIVVLHEGKIAETGTYYELLQRGAAQGGGTGGGVSGAIDGASGGVCQRGSGGNGTSFYDMIRTYMESSSDSETQLLEASNEAELASALEYADAEACAEGKSGKQRSDSASSIGPVSDKQQTLAVSTVKKDRERGQERGADGKLISTEEREVGNVDAKVYWSYAAACGGAKVLSYLLIIYMLAECVNVAASWWLSYWSEHADTGSAGFYLGIYVLINIAVSASMLFREVEIRLKCWKASKLLYADLLSSIMYAPMAFFDTTPLGRILNRFSKDIYTIDEQLPATIRMYVGSLTKVGGVLLYIIVVTPFFIFSLIPIAVFYYFSQKYYIRTSRELSRLESVSRSPIYALFSETIDGMTTIRAYGADQRFTRRNNALLDSNQQAYFLNFCCNCWLAVRLEMAGTCIVAFAALTAVLSRESLRTDSSVTDTAASAPNYAAFSGMAGLAISLSLSITQSLNWTVRMASNLESQMVSVERVSSYSTGIAQEAAYEKSSDPWSSSSNSSSGRHITDISVAIGHDAADDDMSGDAGGRGIEMQNRESWPSKGVIEFRSVYLRYREGLPLVLNNCSFVIQSNEKIGVVGRTGAGKSSLVTALLRLVELEPHSHIYIDDVDISSLGLKALRSHVTVIPQDPVMFSGTIRQNLDPFQAYSDDQIWSSLRSISKAASTTAGNSSSNGNNSNSISANTSFVTSLLDKVEENGSNYSVGQRQLICIARALLTRSKIIVMDEATAAIDVETDAAIQKTIRTDFANATCITIAHRLNTIMDCDKILVMDAGRVAEFDSPQALLARSSSMFSSLVMNWESASH